MVKIRTNHRFVTDLCTLINSHSPNKERKYGQRQLAKDLGIAQSHLSQLKNGRKNPSDKVISKICQLTSKRKGCYLVGYIDPETCAFLTENYTFIGIPNKDSLEEAAILLTSHIVDQSQTDGDFIKTLRKNYVKIKDNSPITEIQNFNPPGCYGKIKLGE